MLKYYVIKANDDVLTTQINLQNVIAIYGKFGEKLNVGYPYKAAYRPLQANMWGYKSADIQDLYIIVEKSYKDYIHDVYAVTIDEERNIVLSMKTIKEEKTEETKEQETSNSKVININKVKQRKRALR